MCIGSGQFPTQFRQVLQQRMAQSGSGTASSSFNPTDAPQFNTPTQGAVSQQGFRQERQTSLLGGR